MPKDDRFVLPSKFLPRLDTVSIGYIDVDWIVKAMAAPVAQAGGLSNDTDTQAPLFYALSSIIMAAAIVSVALRLYVRLEIHKQPGFDDACSAIALLLQIAWTAANDDLFRRGGARHQWEMSEQQFNEVMNVQDALQVVQMATYLFVKLALLLLYRRLFSAKTIFRWAVLVGCAIVVGAHLSFGLLFIFIKKFEAMLRVTYALAWTDLITDVYLWALPLAAVVSLNMPGLRKLGVCILFSAGFL